MYQTLFNTYTHQSSFITYCMDFWEAITQQDFKMNMHIILYDFSHCVLLQTSCSTYSTYNLIVFINKEIWCSITNLIQTYCIWMYCIYLTRLKYAQVIMLFWIEFLINLSRVHTPSKSFYLYVIHLNHNCTVQCITKV